MWKEGWCEYCIDQRLPTYACLESLVDYAYLTHQLDAPLLEDGGGNDFSRNMQQDRILRNEYV